MLSIITPVLNGDRFIENNIKSILELSVPHEHIVVDGGSSDNTLDILNKYPDLKIIHQNDDSGMYGGIDLGIKNSIGDYVCWINSDDTIIPSGFKELYDYAMGGLFDFVCSDGIFKYNDGRKERVVKGTRFAKYFLKKGLFPFSQPSTIFKKEIYYFVNGFDCINFKIAGDMHLFYRIALLQNARFGYLPQLTSMFLKHGNSLGDNNTMKSIIERQNIPSPSFFHSILFKILRMAHI